MRVANAQRVGVLKACIFLQGDITKHFTQGQPPSAPGEIPHIFKGLLFKSIGYEIRGSGKIGLVGTGIGGKDSVGYAMWLEFGTGKMAERPYLRPALARNREKLLQLLRQTMRAALPQGKPTSLAEAARSAGSWNEYQTMTKGQFGASRKDAAAAWAEFKGTK